MGSNSKVVIIGLIAGLAGLGLGIYSFYNILFVPNSEPGYVLVGLWEDLLKNKQNPDFNGDNAWMLEVSNEQVMRNEYVILNTTTGYNHTRFHLIKPGLYKLTINIVLSSLTVDQGYALSAFKDGENYGMNAHKKLFHVLAQASLEHVNVDFYLESNGTNFYEFGCFSIAAPFELTTDQAYNYLSIEYVNL